MKADTVTERILLSRGRNSEPNDVYKSIYQHQKEGIPQNKYVIYRARSVRMGTVFSHTDLPPGK